MSSFKSIGLPRLACYIFLTVLGASCSDPPEMVQYETDTQQLQDVVRDARKDVTQTTEQLRDLKAEKREWEKNTELDEVRAEVDALKSVRDAAMEEVAITEKQFEAMKSARLP